MKSLFTWLIFVNVFMLTAVSQQLQFTNYTPQQGAPVYGANSVFQDSKGWMWFTSGYEVVRYDGHRFKTYHPTTQTKMDFCFRVFEVKGEIWIQAVPQMVRVAGDSLVTMPPGLENLDVISQLDQQNNSWLLCHDGLYRFDNNKVVRFSTDSSLEFTGSETISSFNDSLLISYESGKRLIIFNTKSHKKLTLSKKITDIRRDKNGRVYLMEKGVGILRLKNLIFETNGVNAVTENVIPLSDPAYLNFAIDGQGNFWTYQPFRFLVKLSEGKKPRVYNESDGLPSLWFNYMYVDREQNLWVGFNSGLCKISDSDWERYSGEPLYSSHILFFSRGNEGRVFIGTQSGLNIFYGDSITKVKLGNAPFYCQYLLNAGQTNYYSIDSTLYSMQLESQGQVRNNKKLVKLPARTQQIVLGRMGELIIPTSHGIFTYSNGNYRRLNSANVHYKCAFVDSRGLLWAGKFTGGIECFLMEGIKDNTDLKKLFELDSVSPGLPTVTGIRAIHEDRNGNIFVGTRYNGLFILTLKDNRIEKITHLGEKDGLASNSIWAATNDSEGNVWIANAKGLNSLHYSKENWSIIDEGKKRQIFQATLAFSAPGNMIWIANHPGAVMIRQGSAYQQTPFSVFINSIQVNDRTVMPGRSERFGFRENSIRIGFSATTYRNEEAVLYTWRLHPQDDWSVPSTANEVNFAALQPGRYQFNVRAFNAAGDSSTNEQTFNFEIRAPFWQQAWFIVLITVMIGGIFYLAYRYRMRRLKELYEMRNSIARDLHDEIGSTLTSINILSKVSHRHLGKDDEKATELLGKVIDQSQQIQQNMSDIVWAIRPDNDRFENMTVRMREYLSHTLEPKNISIDFFVEEKIMQENLNMQQRRDFFLIFKEAVNNIAKYSECEKATVKLTRQNGHISLMIIDDGVGFEKDHITSSAGLENMMRRSELLKGRIRINSVPGHGTTIELLLPVTS